MLRSILCVCLFAGSMIFFAGCGGSSSETTVVDAPVPTQQEMDDYEKEMETTIGDE